MKKEWMIVTTASEIDVIVLEGSPKERGLTHGEVLKPRIRELLEQWKYLLYDQFHKNPKNLINELVENTNFLAAIKKWTPQLLVEIEGIAEGAEVEFNEIFAVQLMDEGGWYLDALNQNPTQRCSSLGCFKEENQPTLVAQNLDWTNDIEGFHVILHIKHPESSLESLVPTVAGVVGTCGVNNKAIGICTNALWRDLNSSINGLPVNFIVRVILEQPDLNTASAFLQQIQHASAENYVIGDAQKVVNFECSAHKVVQYIPYEGARRVYHTNHPLVNDDFITPPKRPLSRSTSHARFDYLEWRLNNPSKQITLETVKYILSSHQGPVCAHHNYQPGAVYTFCSVIYSLSDSPELHIAVGPPCSSAYKKFTFSSRNNVVWN